MNLEDVKDKLTYQVIKTDDGKECPYFVADTQISKQLSGFSQIMDDLRHAKKLIPRIDSASCVEVERAIWTSAVILYGKCFASAEGRRTKLEERDHIAPIGGDATELHTELMRLRNKYIAHAGGSAHEESGALVILSPEENGKKIGLIGHTTVAQFKISPEYRDKLLSHLGALFDIVEKKVNQLHPQVLHEYQQYDINELYQRAKRA